MTATQIYPELNIPPKVYSSTASVYVTATSGTVNQVANGRTTGAVNLDTQAQVLGAAAPAAAGGPPGQDPTGVIDLSAAEAEEAPSSPQGS